MNNPDNHIIGLTEEQVLESRKKFGANRLSYHKDNPFIDAFKGIAKEPMVILLLATAMIYFISGRIGDGIFMTVAIAIVSTI